MKNELSRYRRLTFRISLFCSLGLLLTADPAIGTECFVSKQGRDTNSGLSQDQAFLTIQKGVDALKPGDTLTIAPGEYFENVKRVNLGGANADTVIRAEIPGTAVLRGDVPAPKFKKVDGYRFVYAAKFDQEPKAVLEHHGLFTLFPKANVTELEFDPGFFHYDAKSKMLYISNPDLSAPDERRYTVAISGTSGLVLNSPKRVVIDGLAATGFYPEWGILLGEPVSCTIRNCVSFMNVGGILLAPNKGLARGDGGSNNVVEKCIAYGNIFGGIVRYGANNDIIRNCHTYKNVREGREHFGIMHYFTMTGPLLFKNNISWGHNFNYSVKHGNQQERLENCVGLGYIRISTSKMSHNLISGGNESDHGPKAPADSIFFLREKNLDRDFEFADPLNLDFHLQSDSRFRGTAPDGSDRGPYPYKANIFYVSPAGDDQADGLSMRKPWQTLKHALKRLRPGDTLYLSEGKYAPVPWNKAGDGKSPIRIFGRGRGTVVITSKLNVTGGAGIVFERLNFAEGADVVDSHDVTFKNCTFFGRAGDLNADKVRNLKVTHSVFAGAALSLTKTEGVTLSGNIYANADKPAIRLDVADAILYSDYNSYQNKAQCWKVSGMTWSFAKLQEQQDRYSQSLSPKFAMEEGVPRIMNDDVFNGRGPHSAALGIHHEYDATPKAPELVGPFLHSVSDTTANIEWWTSKPATFELAWGETPEMKNRIKNLKTPDCFTTYSLTGLKPGVKYYFRIRSADTSGRGEAVFAKVLKPDTAPISFTTLAVAPKPKVYYVAPDGDNDSTGLSRAKAWRTVSHAAGHVNAGDTVLIAGGAYKETVRIRATGDEAKPITFRCIPGEKVVFEGLNLLQAFKVIVKKNINFDGLYFVHFGDSMSAVFVLWQGDHVQITRCFNVKRTGNAGFIHADFSADLLVKNCVAARGFSIARLYVCPRWRIENNLFLRPLIESLNFVNEPEQKGFLRKNIITDNQPTKVVVQLLEIGKFESFVEEDNCYFLRVPDEQRKMFMFYGTTAYEKNAQEYGLKTNFSKPPVFQDKPDGTEDNPRLSLKQYQAMVGDTGSYVGDPKFAGLIGVKEGGKTWNGYPSMMFDKLLGKKNLDFPDIFATDPKAVKMGIGPQPEAFKDFWFNKKK